MAIKSSCGEGTVGCDPGTTGHILESSAPLTGGSLIFNNKNNNEFNYLESQFSTLFPSIQKMSPEHVNTSGTVRDREYTPMVPALLDSETPAVLILALGQGRRAVNFKEGAGLAIAMLPGERVAAQEDREAQRAGEQQQAA